MVDVVVSIDDQQLQAMSSVMDRLREAGMQIDESMEAIGTVVGRIPAEQLEVLQHIDGVAHVARSGTFQIPPPDSDVL